MHVTAVHVHCYELFGELWVAVGTQHVAPFKKLKVKSTKHKAVRTVQLRKVQHGAGRSSLRRGEQCMVSNVTLTVRQPVPHDGCSGGSSARTLGGAHEFDVPDLGLEYSKRVPSCSTPIPNR